MESLSFLIPLSPIIVNVVCIMIKKGKIISLIATLCAVLFSLLMLAINSGYGIGFGNPWIGVDWGFSVFYALYIAVLLATHWFVPSTGIIRKISVIFVVLAGICTLFLIGSQIAETIQHSQRL
jgi:hypothetical protein